MDSERQVVEITGGVTGGSLQFAVESVDGTPFECALVQEGQLQKNEFEYNTMDKGYIFGMVKDISSPRYLVLRSHTPTQATLTIRRKSPAVSAGGIDDEKPATPLYKRPVVWAAAAGALVVVYWLYKNSKKTTDASKSENSSLLSLADDSQNQQSGFGF